MAVILADLQSWGKVPNLKEVSDIICNGCTISFLISHRTLGCIESGPGDFDVFKSLRSTSEWVSGLIKNIDDLLSLKSYLN